MQNPVSSLQIAKCGCGGTGRRAGLKNPFRKEYRFDPDHPHHRLAAMAAQRDDEGGQRGNEPDKSVNQQCEINVGHGFLLVFVRLDWRDVSEVKSRFAQHNRKGRAAPRDAG